MRLRLPPVLAEFRERLAVAFTGSQMLAFIPALTLAAFWIGGEGALVAIALSLPVIWVMLGGTAPAIERHLPPPKRKGLVSPDAFRVIAQAVCVGGQETTTSAIIAVELDDFATLKTRLEPGAIDQVIETIGQRLRASSHDHDAISQIGESRFIICLDPVVHLDVESCLQLSSRIQHAVEEPIAMDGTVIYVSACIGFCLLRRAPARSGSDWMNAAIAALHEAQNRGPTSVRAYTNELHTRLTNRANLREEVVMALETGQILPWFQPQISTETGKVTGFEALARWIHAERGPILPAEFLPAIEDAGLLERLADAMLCHTFTALKAWDAAGVHVPHVGVNFSSVELSNPRLFDKINWELDRFDLTPDRLAVEILETVVTGSLDDTITRNINGLTELGCRVDLDDFGTGHASIAAVRRFGMARIKIDRSFVAKADRDPEQQRMVSAILNMAERLGIETLAEGVETAGEHALLAQLGCHHVQGFGIAHPMPFEKTMDWIRQHETKLRNAPTIQLRGAN